MASRKRRPVGLDDVCSHPLRLSHEQRASKTRGRQFCRNAARAEAEPATHAAASTGPEDCPLTPWLHLHVTKGMERKAKQMEEGSGLVRAMSAPFFFEGVLSQEVKWVGCEDDVSDVMPFRTILGIFGSHEPFLEWVSFWDQRMKSGYPQEMLAMRRMMQRVPVRHSASDCGKGTKRGWAVVREGRHGRGAG